MLCLHPEYSRVLHRLITIPFLFSAEKSRGRQLREDAGLGAGALAAHRLHCAQHGAASAVLQRAQPGLQQQGHQPLRRTLREPHPLFQHLPYQGHETGKQQAIFQQSQAKNRRDGRKRFSGRSDKNLSIQDPN